MPPEPSDKRAVAFVDGQNLFHAAREAFGYTYPNYDVRALAERACAGRGWQLVRARAPYAIGIGLSGCRMGRRTFSSLKGIDVRIALDVIRMAHQRAYDVAVIFSQDQDLSEVAEEIRVIAKEQGRWIKVACAFPLSPTTRNRRGVNNTDWIPITRETYDGCLDQRDYYR